MDDKIIEKCINDIELEIDKLYFYISNNNTKLSKYLCYCKQMILKHYFYISKITINNIILELFKVSKNKDYEINLEKIFNTYNNNIFKFLYRYENVSKKILIFFEKTQTVIDKLFFKKIEFFYKKIKSGKLTLSNQIFIKKFLITWVETSIFNLLSLEIPCENIIDKENLNKEFCYNDIIECNIHKNIISTGPFIYFVIQPELINTNYFEIYIETLKEMIDLNILKTINVIVDYQFISKRTLNNIAINRYINVAKIVKEIFIINTENVIITDEFKNKVLNNYNVKILNQNIVNIYDFLSNISVEK